MSNYKGFKRFYNGIKPETYYSKEEISKLITEDYIRGLIEGEGHFGVDTRNKSEKVPCFVLKMHVRDKELIESIRDFLELNNWVYEYKNQGRHFAMLIVRDIPTLKNKIVPFFKYKLLGHKGTQFDWWLDHFPYLDSLYLRKNSFSCKTCPI